MPYAAMASLGKSSKKRKHAKNKKQNKSQTSSKKKPKPSKLFPDSDNSDDEPKPVSDSDADSISGSESDSDSDLETTDNLPSLLEPYTKSQLIDLISDAAARDASLHRRIREFADRDVSHRKIFVHGLAWDATKETLATSFGRYGEIEDCNVVLEKATGKAKGYGFVLFKTRKGARKSLRSPQKKINNRIATCQLASLGPPSSGGAGSSSAGAGSASSRKIYVGNVPADTDVVRFRDFFAKFGEIETGPIGFDVRTGRSRGFALFVYKTASGFERALREPHKVFEGHKLHCQKAAETKSKSSAAAAAPPIPEQAMPMPVPVPYPHHHHSLAYLSPMMYGAGGGYVPGIGLYGGYSGAGAGAGRSVSSPETGLQQVYSSRTYQSPYMW